MVTEITAVRPERHEALPEPGTAYTVAGRRTGLPADIRNTLHYPVEATCSGCGQVIRCERMLSIGPGAEWAHTGRMPGEGPA